LCWLRLGWAIIGTRHTDKTFLQFAGTLINWQAQSISTLIEYTILHELLLDSLSQFGSTQYLQSKPRSNGRGFFYACAMAMHWAYRQRVAPASFVPKPSFVRIGYVDCLVAIALYDSVHKLSQPVVNLSLKTPS